MRDSAALFFQSNGFALYIDRSDLIRVRVFWAFAAQRIRQPFADMDFIGLSWAHQIQRLLASSTTYFLQQHLPFLFQTVFTYISFAKKNNNCIEWIIWYIDEDNIERAAVETKIIMWGKI